MDNPLSISFPSFGWRQMLTGRERMIAAYDIARVQSKAHPVETLHGVAGEAAVRDWLAEFLPRRYGVTAGYVVSPGHSDEHKAPHFDVIIYDQLESPVLWTEEPAKSRAIPVEYVLCVLEVKATFSKQNVKDGMKHLRELVPLMSGLDADENPYKLHLPKEFCCALVFMELREEKKNEIAALSEVVECADLRGFLGGVILRSYRFAGKFTATIRLLQGKDKMDAITSEHGLADFCMCATSESPEGYLFAAMLTWSESSLTQFAFDLIASMQGRHLAGRISSFYGLGSSTAEQLKAMGIDLNPPSV